jgi:hypothetical protein
VCCFLSSSSGDAADPTARDNREPLTLLGMLGEWQYPDSKFHGAKMSDAAVKDISSVKCKAVLTTPDPVDKVLAHYRDKLKVDSEGNPLGSNAGKRVTSDRAVVIQDKSDGRKLKLTIIHVHEKRSSTMLAISRSQDENETHIVWTHFRQVWPE